VTIVAAWMSAETGVGPAIASGSQTNSGICADLPAAATSSSRPMATAVPLAISGAIGRTSAKASEPVALKTRNIAIMNPTSPMRLTTKAFFAAVA